MKLSLVFASLALVLSACAGGAHPSTSRTLYLSPSLPSGQASVALAAADEWVAATAGEAHPFTYKAVVGDPSALGADDVRVLPGTMPAADVLASTTNDDDGFRIALAAGADEHAIAHELGHALGLSHDYAEPNLMGTAIATCIADHVTAVDVAHYAAIWTSETDARTAAEITKDEEAADVAEASR